MAAEEIRLSGKATRARCEVSGDGRQNTAICRVGGRRARGARALRAAGEGTANHGIGDSFLMRQVGCENHGMAGCRRLPN